MPLGTIHSETGLLLSEGANLILQRDLGGRRRLNVDVDVVPLLGQRVLVEGIRSGFDLLDVSRVVRSNGN